MTLVFHNLSIDIRSLQFHDMHILHDFYIVSYARNVPYLTSNSPKTSVDSTYSSSRQEPKIGTVTHIFFVPLHYPWPN